MSVVAPQQHNLIWNLRNQAAGSYNLRQHWLCYQRVDFFVLVSALNGAPSAATFDLKLQQKLPSIGSTWFDITGKAIVQVTQATALSNFQVISLNPLDVRSKDMRFSVTAAFTGGTAPSFTVSLGWQGWL